MGYFIKIAQMFSIKSIYLSGMGIYTRSFKLFQVKIGVIFRLRICDRNCSCYTLPLLLFFVSCDFSIDRSKPINSVDPQILRIEVSSSHPVTRESRLPVSGIYQIANVYDYPIGNIFKIKHANGYFVFKDENRIIIVNANGDFIGDSLEHYGKQAGGYQNIQDFEIQEDSLVYILDPRSRQLLSYNFDFQFIKAYPLHEAIDIPISDFHIEGNNLILLQHGLGEKQSVYTFTKVNLNNNQIKARQSVYLPPGLLPLFHTDPLKRTDSQLIFKTTYCSDIIYVLSTTMLVKPVRQIVFEDQPIFSSIFAENPDPKYHSDHYEILTNYDENEDYILFTSMKKATELKYEFSIFIWNKDQKILSKSPLEKYFVNVQCFGITDDNIVYSIVEPEALLMYKDEYPDKADKLTGMQNVTMNDNPYIVQFSIADLEN